MTRLAALLLVVSLGACSGEPGAEGSHPGPGEAAQPSPSTGSGSVRVAPDVFGFFDDGTGSYETVRVSGTFDIGAVVAALRRAGGRFMLVDEEGTEYPTESSLEEATLNGPKYLYSPNYVADPRILDGGVDLYVDCKGVIEPPMAATFRRILEEELERAQVTNVTVQNAPRW